MNILFIFIVGNGILFSSQNITIHYFSIVTLPGCSNICLPLYLEVDGGLIPPNLTEFYRNECLFK